MIDLRLGLWQHVLADVSGVDAVICDPPYGARTHSGYRTGADASDDSGIGYDAMTPDDVDEFMEAWATVRGWIVAFTSHDLLDAWERAAREVGRYPFAPLPVVISGSGVRLQGDGPSSDSVWLCVSRPRTSEFARWGTLPGHYLTRAERGASMGRGKPLDLMRAIVSDYSRPGDLVCDPFAGYGTTARACAQLGRRFVGAECDADAYAEAQRRLAEVVTVDVQGLQRVRQEALL